MFDNIFAAIEKWMRELLSGMVESNLSTMFTAVNQQTSEIAAQVGQTPQGWNSSIFSMIRNISDSVVIPIAGIIITLILCYELISMLTERNNLHDVDTWMFFKYFVKMWIAVYLVTHTFDIAMAVFDIGQSVVNSSSGIIRGNTAIDISSLSMQMQAAMATMAIGDAGIGNPCRKLVSENSVGSYHGNYVRQNDRNIPLHFACSDSICNHEQP